MHRGNHRDGGGVGVGVGMRIWDVGDRVLRNVGWKVSEGCRMWKELRRIVKVGIDGFKKKRRRWKRMTDNWKNRSA